MHFDIMVNKVPWKGECILLYEKFVWFIYEDEKKVLCEPSIHYHQILTLIEVLVKKQLPYADTFYFCFCYYNHFSTPHLSIKACRTKLQLNFTRRIIQSQCYCMSLYQKRFCFAFANKIVRVTARMYNQKLAKKHLW